MSHEDEPGGGSALGEVGRGGRGTNSSSYRRSAVRRWKGRLRRQALGGGRLRVAAGATDQVS